MLFNSFFFIFGFLPAVLLIYYGAGRGGRQFHALVWLIAASLFFYAWWRPSYTLVLFTSIAVNYALGSAIGRSRERYAGLLLIVGVTFNLAILGYYKYAGFFADLLADLSIANWHARNIVLPLAISFFTFQQIAWLVDCRRGITKAGNPLDYVLFVTFFPQLISGPIVHHREMMPQFRRPERLSMHRYLAVGMTLFIFGLFKKTVFADGIGAYAAEVFNASPDEHVFTSLEVIGGALGYGLQIYFDFSGYSDMAVGLAYLFGIRLPVNFYSPYKAVNISEFWRRWHMTLSRFLRDYLYIPLGGNRHGNTRRFTSLMITMLLGGLWHGANWTFVLWGGIHGALLLIFHAYAMVRRRGANRDAANIAGNAGRIIATATTFSAVTLAWIPFRAADLDTTWALYAALINTPPTAAVGPFATTYGCGLVSILLAWIWLAPNSNELLGQFDPAIKPERFNDPQRLRLSWSPNLWWCLVTVALLWICLVRMMTSGYVEFLYRFF